MNQQQELTGLARLFLKLGCTAFGGPAAHIAMMRQEVVQKRGWMTDQHFLDLVGATNLIPGPNSTEMAIHIGRERGGWKGLLIAGACFIVPAVCITGVFAWLYHDYGHLPNVQPFIYGIKPAIIPVILAAVYPMARLALKSTFLAALGVLALIAALAGLNEIAVLFGAGVAALIVKMVRQQGGVAAVAPFFPLSLLQVPAPLALQGINLKLAMVFLKTGAILYGSGYVLFAFLDAELVRTGLLSRQVLTDAIAVGQFTPGPVFSSVTFIGYQINGLPGAVVSTIAIFLPAFLFVALLNPLVRKMRGSALVAAFLDAVNIASVAIIIAVCYTMGRESIADWRSVTIALLSGIISFRYRQVNSAWIVLGGALAGYLLSLW